MTDLRIGFGYDVHQFSAGRKLILGGVEIPSAKGLLGHSDADVLLHALMDSMLGAAALGDIGIHFPPSDDRWKNSSSLDLLVRVIRLVTEAGWMIINSDMTVVLESPKIMAYSETMRKNIARVIGIGVDRISIKATTSEGMGFIGHGEGASAYAITMIGKT